MSQGKKSAVGQANAHDTIFIREKTALPADFCLKSEMFAPGWRVVTNFDRSALASSIEEAKWYFFYLTGEMKATVFGGDSPATVRRAVKAILAKQTKLEFNSLEITEVAPKRFWGLPFLSVTAHSRHIQERMSLLCMEDRTLSMLPAASR
jgi:hypothetical protein